MNEWRYARAGRLFLAAVVGLAAMRDACANQPMRMVVGFAAGGVNDLVAREIAAPLSKRLGVSVVVDNRVGAGGNISAELVARAEPDGNTVLMGEISSLGVAPALHKALPYDPVNDFAPVTQVVTVPSLFAVHPSAPARTLKDFVDLAKTQPGKLSVANPGVGSIAHLAAELFMNSARANVSFVPYKGGAPAVNDVLGGHVLYLVSTLSTAAPHVQSGKLIGLAVTSNARFAGLPNVPTIAESGYPGFAAEGWLGILFPARTSVEIVTRMHREVLAILKTAEVRTSMESRGLVIKPSDTPEAFRVQIREEIARWKKLVQETQLRIEGH